MNYRRYIVIALLSLSVLATELLWTRIFSAEFFYTFAFLILSLAVLGLGLGALCFSLFVKNPKPALLSVWLTAAGSMIAISLPLVFALNLDFSKVLAETGQLMKILSAILLLGSANFFAGLALAQIFRTHASDMPRLYMADLLGAAAGGVVFILTMNAWGPLAALMLCVLPLLAAGTIAAEGKMRLVPAAAAVFVLAGYLGFSGGSLPEQKREERAPVIYTHWDATAKLKVSHFDSTYRSINIDNVANTPVYGTDGNWNLPDSQKFRFDIDVRNLISKFPQCRFLSLGAGGGGDVCQALQYNAAEIHAVEVIPHINEMMKSGLLQKFSGNIYNDPRVTVVTEDARTYIRRFENKFDVIYSLSSNTWAAMASGSFALAENYLFTKEAFKEYWRALSDSGFMSVEHQFYIPRIVPEVIAALEELNVQDPKSHIAVYELTSLRRRVLLLSKQQLSDSLIAGAYANSNPQVLAKTKRMFPASEANRGNIVNTIIQHGWEAVAETSRVNVSPCTDDRPFIAQIGLMRNIRTANLEKLPQHEFTGFPISRIVLLVILAACLIIIVPLNFVPYLKHRGKLPFASWLYFFAIGMGFMIVEVIEIQKYTLFIGSSVYSTALVLTVLLVASGIGSRFSGKFSALTVFAAVVCWLAVDILLFRQLFYVFTGWPLWARMTLSAVLIAPAGFFMGMPFPKAAVRHADVVDWAFAVNGSASVIGSVLAVLIASSIGYSTALVAGLVCYAVAYLLFRRGNEGAVAVN